MGFKRLRHGSDAGASIRPNGSTVKIDVILQALRELDGEIAETLK